MMYERCVLALNNSYNRIEKIIGKINTNKNLKYSCWGIVILLCFSAILFLNILTPYIADDFGYFFIYAENNIRVTRISDIVHSQINHYYLWGGRSVVHFIAQALLMLPPLAIDIINSGVYLLYIFLIYLHIIGRKKYDLLLFILINFAVWFIQPAYGDTILWVTGSANYLWGTSLILLYLLPFRFYKGKNNRLLINIISSIIFFVFSILAGWTNENTVAGMLIITILYIIYYHSKQWEIPIWSIAGLIGATIGYVIMIIAPGNQVRASEAGDLTLFLICYRFLMHTSHFIFNCGLLNIFYFTSMILFYHFTKGDKSDVIKKSLLYFIGSIVGIYAMLLSPSFPPRAWFGIITFNIIASGIIFYNIDYRYKLLRKMKLGLLFMGIIAFIFSFYFAVKDIYPFYKISTQRIVLVHEAKKQGLDSCCFERYIGKTKFIHSEDLHSNYLLSPYYEMTISFKKVD